MDGGGPGDPAPIDRARGVVAEMERLRSALLGASAVADADDLLAVLIVIRRIATRLEREVRPFATAPSPEPGVAPPIPLRPRDDQTD